MKKLRWIAVLSLGLVSLGMSVPASAQVKYDAPDLSFVESGYFRVTLQVHSGASGAPGGFVVAWMKKSDYDLRGGWPVDEDDPAVARCEFSGVPTLNVDLSSPSFQLEPSGRIKIEIGDLFDETGLVASYGDHVPTGTEYVFRAHAVATPEAGESDWSSTLYAGTLMAPECTQGFWKNHEEAWPPGCTPMLLGTVSYTKQQLLDIFNTPSRGNGLVSLAHQLIAVKLNACNGSDISPVLTTITAADALIDGLVIPPVGSGYVHPSSTSAMTQTLDNYNNGTPRGVAGCPQPTPTRPTTWGSLKLNYR